VFNVLTQYEVIWGKKIKQELLNAEFQMSNAVKQCYPNTTVNSTSKKALTIGMETKIIVITFSEPIHCILDCDNWANKSNKHQLSKDILTNESNIIL